MNNHARSRQNRVKLNNKRFNLIPIKGSKQPLVIRLRIDKRQFDSILTLFPGPGYWNNSSKPRIILNQRQKRKRVKH